MARGILLLIMCLLGCKSLSGQISFTEETVGFDAEGKIISRGHDLIIFTESEHSSEIKTLNANGVTTDIWRTERHGNKTLTYNNDALYSLSKQDPKTGCEVERIFRGQLFSELTKCSNREIRSLHIDNIGTTETNCSLQGTIETCQTSTNGKSFTKTISRIEENVVIDTDEIFNTDQTKTYYKLLTKPIADGEQKEFYIMDLPITSAMPMASDNRWHLWKIDTFTGFLPKIGRYSSIKMVDFDEETTVLRTIRLN